MIYRTRSIENAADYHDPSHVDTIIAHFDDIDISITSRRHVSNPCCTNPWKSYKTKPKIEKEHGERSSFHVQLFVHPPCLSSFSVLCHQIAKLDSVSRSFVLSWTRERCLAPTIKNPLQCQPESPAKGVYAIRILSYFEEPINPHRNCELTRSDRIGWDG